MQYKHFYELASTNDYIKGLSTSERSDWLIVWTSKQTQGRGYIGNTWQSEEGKNLTMSVGFRIKKGSNLLEYNLWVSCCIRKFLAEKFLCKPSVKWPNDLILKDKKIAGLLLESISSNQEYLIVGLGLNLNQTHFEGLPQAESLFNLTGLYFEPEEILLELIDFIHADYLSFSQSKASDILAEYNRHLYKLNKKSYFSRDEKTFHAIVKKVDENGYLWLEEGETLKKYQHKEIKQLFPD